MNHILSITALLTLLLTVQMKSEYKVTQTSTNSTTVTLQLQYFGKDSYYLQPSSPIVKKLGFTFHCLASGEFDFKIVDLDNKRFEVLKGEPFPQDQKQNFSFPLTNCGVNLKYQQNPFDFQIRKTKSQVLIFSTYEGDFIYSNYYIQISTSLSTNKVYGLGQRFSINFRKYDAQWTIFNKAGDQIIDYGTGNNSYGYYPFYLHIDANNEPHINYLKTTNALDVIKSTQKGQNRLTFKIVGGIINFRFMLSKQGDVISLIKDFHETCIGKPAIPPFWALGFHQSRWGYDSVNALNQVLTRYEEQGIPLDTIWSDIDYMDEFKDFTVDTDNFPLDKMKQITDKYRYVLIVDAGVAKQSEAYQIGHSRDIFMKDLRGKEVKGVVWPGDTAFVDYFHPNATQYWTQMLQGLNQKLNFSGIWLDMNQIQQFCDGPCERSNQSAIIDYTKDLPYQPGSSTIENSTISLNLTHYGNISQFNVHPYFALQEAYATNQYLKKKSKFPFILSRSTTFGSSKYTFHWTGDNHASWQFLRSSIVDNMNMNMAGIQMVGPDICGFGSDTTEELCARWYQLSAVYPFARSHNDYWSIPQEPYSLGDIVLRIAYNSIKLRYALICQYYSYWIFQQGLTPFFSSLAYYPKALSNITDQSFYDQIISTQFFIMNQPLMVAPILEQGKTQRIAFFPNYTLINASRTKTSLYFDIQTGERYQPGVSATIPYKGPASRVPMFIVAGHTLLMKRISSITKTTQFDNNYVFFTAFDLVKTIGSIQYYQSYGQILAIDDFSDQDLVQEFVRVGDRYVFNLYFTFDTEKTLANLRIIALYSGFKAKRAITISSITFLLDGGLLSYVFPDLIKIYENVDVDIPILDHKIERGEMAWDSIMGEMSRKKSFNLETQ